MPRRSLIAALLPVLCLLTGTAVAAPSAPAGLERMIGDWEGEGQLFGRPATFSMTWSWVLEGRFVELRFENRMVQEDGSEQPVLRSVALYQVGDGEGSIDGDLADAELSGSWFDTRGQVVALRAIATADGIATRWTAATEEGRTTYRVTDSDTIEVLDEVRSGDDWRPFGSATYRRVGTETAAPGHTMTGESMTMRASGGFDVRLEPLETYNQSPDAKVSRMSIDKTFTGDLVGTSQGEMLSGGSPAEGSAGYVAIEHVTGTLAGREGSFLLQHSGTMTPDERSLTITVVPDSGTAELEGLAGTMDIDIRDGQHFYVFEYSLPDE